MRATAVTVALIVALVGLAVMMAHVNLPPQHAGCVRPEECR